MWDSTTVAIPRGVEHRVLESGAPLSFRQFFENLRSEPAFADWYSGLLNSFEAEAIYWELPPLTQSTVDDDARFVLIEAPGLARLPTDSTPFNAHFEQNPEAEIVVFPNLGGDATLIVPAPRGPDDAYPHFAAFLRKADRHQVQSLWRATAETVLDSVGEKPLWVNTAGGGVFWLHVRLDSRPKYYQHQPYTSFSTA